ncbi:uncharacterized protein LOC129600903 isoform X2 [Paramacrobiotus metropolitanus]|nr:uncharacterized protein LOC129600903 isoform X2 [Paramacrobiotus metropolitanus]XP_055355538.1 uncharacterized protein LOC129600903 isoform X2 [Paramacrobiotus metropolitanus]XP_055355539.1 uncharacterized protein LOC129600903 isoform X2 [Paramacrobiotus metropolitanus]XP_055355540.1 uncharacterized protein LOC129600903 isoform X2 [Paramacrobiotus metropolitanus]XP_055355541.1 uncharacterized protein LOC129600903 isoform X2 [Paramacrobiotus metropolitanus]XP_055355542.1 uncharacterized prot
MIYAAVHGITDVNVPGVDQDDDSAEDTAVAPLSAVPVVSRHLGSSYDLMRANPFSSSIDPGLINDMRLLPTTYRRGNRCPTFLAECNRSGNGRPLKQTSTKIFINAFSDYQRAMKKSVEIIGKFKGDLINGMGLLASELDPLREDLAEGTFYVDLLNMSIHEHAQLKYGSFKILTDEVAAAVCDLSPTYDADAYIAFLQRFGTHAVVDVQLVTFSRRRIPIHLQDIFQYYVQNGVTFSGQYQALAEKLKLDSVTPKMLDSIAKEILKDPASAARVISETVENVPWVTKLVDISSLLSTDRINGSSADNCRAVVDGLDKRSVKKWLSTIQANLRRALQDYRKQSQAERPNQPPQTIPWPPGIRNRIRAIQSRALAHPGEACLGDMTYSLLGRGYDLLRADPLGGDIDLAVHRGPSLLDFRPCAVERSCQEPISCATVRSTNRDKMQVTWQNKNDYQEELLERYVVVKTPLHPTVAKNTGILSPTLREISKFLAADATVTDHLSYTTFQQAKLVYSNDDLILEPRFLAAVCALPDHYDRNEYVAFLKEFGTHIITRVRYGNFSSKRIVRYRSGGRNSKLLRVAEGSMRPVALTIANITSFLTPYVVRQSPVGSECRSITYNVTALQRRRKFLDDAMIDYAKKPRFFIKQKPTTTSTTTTTAAPLTTTTTAMTTPVTVLATTKTTTMAKSTILFSTTTTASPTTTTVPPTTTTIHPIVFQPRGIARGVVRDADTSHRLGDVSVIAQLTGESFRSTETSDAAGEFALSLPSATYIFHFELSGYYTAVMHNKTVTAHQELILEPILYINRRFIGLGVASGLISNAFTGMPESDVDLQFREGINAVYGNVVATAKTVNGSWSVNLPTGHYTAAANKPSFTPMTFTVVILGGIVRANQNSVISPVIGSEETRFVLKWGETPLDLDLHIRGPNDGIMERMHVYWPKWLMVSPDGHTNLDVDDVSSYGPETITVTKQLSGVYRVSVHDYTYRQQVNNDGLPNSGATLEMYRGARQVGQYFVPSNHNGTVWSVLEMDGQEVTVLNDVSTVESPVDVY